MCIRDRYMGLNCDVNIKGSWCIFDPIDGVSPIDHSAKGFSFDEKDKKMLKSLRSFSKDYFGKNELSAVTLKQAASKKPSDFDVLCFVSKLSLIHISEPTRPLYISYAVFCLKKKKPNKYYYSA
eukprot:TRINITY_DN7807_c0_g1_i2.p2 TRINITY_DN7807_c0_g1~~TRINITY_DN7807_c0_g1_i2.p2  ORF type:complete len:124 (-),score=29.26 TRINITY_DN7807_c0_g1_i2:46-417(-)